MLGQRRGSAKRSVLPRRRQDLLAPLLGATRKTRAQLSNYPATRLQSSAHFMESFTNCSASKRPARTVNNLPLLLWMSPWMALAQPLMVTIRAEPVLVDFPVKTGGGAVSP